MQYYDKPIRYYNTQKGRTQEGIYYADGKNIGNHFGVLLLTIEPDSKLNDVKEIIQDLWTLLLDEKNKTIQKNRYKKAQETLEKRSILFGYGNFILKKLKQVIPKEYSGYLSFNAPNGEGGGFLTNYSKLRYSENITENQAEKADLIIQIIAEDQTFIDDLVIMVKKRIAEIYFKKKIIRVCALYKGYKRKDNIGFLGFNEGIANIKPDKRYDAIFLQKRGRSSLDNRLVNSTFLAFIRFKIDIENWMKLNINDQTLIIGRDKNTGCTITGIDKKGNPIKQYGCPSTGTNTVLDPKNIRFRTQEIYEKLNYNHAYTNSTNLILGNSHTARMYNIISENKKRNIFAGIFRQGFDFLESIDNGKNIVCGLNFISFQNDLKLLFDCINLGFGNQVLQENRGNYGLEKYISILAAGIFLVPPVFDDKFPGFNLFNTNF